MIGKLVTLAVISGGIIFIFSKVEASVKSMLMGSQGSFQDTNWMNKQQNEYFQKDFQDEFNRMQQEDSDRRFNEEMERDIQESLKTVTPWEHGGYDMTQGNSFNDHNMHGF